jgi:hypothetical protein
MVNEWNKTALVAEFETMLQRRLRSGAAPVAACAGFDLDAASAYLEGALGGSHRAGYESHLAGCVTCRRHLIELARLAQTTPLAEPQPATAPGRIKAWDRWKEAVAVWFDLSSRSFKWRIAGATGAAFAILIAAFGAQSWRLVSRQPVIKVTDNTVASSSHEAPDVQSPLPSPTPETSAQAEGASLDAPLAGDVIATNRERPQVTAPAPSVGPQGSAPNIAALEASARSMVAPSNQPGEAPVAPKPMPTLMPDVAETGLSPSSRLSGFIANESLAAGARSVLTEPREESNEQAAKDPVGTFRPSPPRGLNPMKPGHQETVVSRRGLALVPARQSKQNPEPNSKPADPKSTSLIKDVMGFVWRNPLKWPLGSESEQKAIGDAPESADSESTAPMVMPFRGKVFLRVKGMWIDQEYKPEMQEWRRWTLTRDSEQYKRVLADEPQLKEFFDKGPILIVWKNRIYKVLKPRKPGR